MTDHDQPEDLQKAMWGTGNAGQYTGQNASGVKNTSVEEDEAEKKRKADADKKRTAEVTPAPTGLTQEDWRTIDQTATETQNALHEAGGNTGKIKDIYNRARKKLSPEQDEAMHGSYRNEFQTAEAGKNEEEIAKERAEVQPPVPDDVNHGSSNYKPFSAEISPEDIDRYDREHEESIPAETIEDMHPADRRAYEERRRKEIEEGRRDVVEGESPLTGKRSEEGGEKPEDLDKDSVIEDRSGQLSGMNNPDLTYRYMEKVGSAIAQAAAEMGGSMVSRGWDLASDIVRMTFTQPHAMSSTSRMIGTAMGSLELAGDFADRAAQKYGVNLQQDPGLIKDTIKYKLYQREAKQANGVVGNTFRAISDSLGKMGVQDISQMTPDQLSQHVADMRQEASRLMGIIAKDKENLQLGKRQNRLSSQDRGLVYAQAKHLQSYLDQLSKQGATMAADQRMMARQQRQASRRQRMQAQSTLANGSANPYQQILQWADPNANWEIDGNTGMPTQTGAYNIMLRTLRDRREQERRANNGVLDPAREQWYNQMDQNLTQRRDDVQREIRQAPIRQYGNVFVGMSDHAPGIGPHINRILRFGIWPSTVPVKSIRDYLANIVQKGAAQGASAAEINHARALLLSLDMHTRTRTMMSKVGHISPRKAAAAMRYHIRAGDVWRTTRLDAAEAQKDEAILSKAYMAFNAKLPKDFATAQNFDPNDPAFQQALHNYERVLIDYENKWFPLRAGNRQSQPAQPGQAGSGQTPPGPGPQNQNQNQIPQQQNQNPQIIPQQNPQNQAPQVVPQNQNQNQNPSGQNQTPQSQNNGAGAGTPGGGRRAGGGGKGGKGRTVNPATQANQRARDGLRRVFSLRQYNDSGGRRQQPISKDERIKQIGAMIGDDLFKGINQWGRFTDEADYDAAYNALESYLEKTYPELKPEPYLKNFTDAFYPSEKKDLNDEARSMNAEWFKGYFKENGIDLDENGRFKSIEDYKRARGLLIGKFGESKKGKIREGLKQFKPVATPAPAPISAPISAPPVVEEIDAADPASDADADDEPEFFDDGSRNWVVMPMVSGDDAKDMESAKKVYDALGDDPKAFLEDVLQKVNTKSDKVKFADVGQMLDAFSRVSSMDPDDPLSDTDVYMETKNRPMDDPIYQATLAASRVADMRPQLEKMGVWDNIVGTPAQSQAPDTPQSETEVPQTDKDTSQTDAGGTQVPETPVTETEQDQKEEGTDEFVEDEEIEEPVKRIEMTPDQVKHKHNLSIEFGMDEDKIDEHLDSFLKNAGFSSGSRPGSGNSYKKILSAVKASHIYDEIRDKAIRTGREEALAQTIQKYIMEYNNLTQVFPSLKESASDIDKKTKDKLKNRVINFKKTTHDINIDKEIGNEESGVDPGKDLKFLKQFEDELFHAYPPSSGNKTSPEYDKFEKYIKDWTRNHKYVQGKSSYAKLIRDYVMSPEGLNGQWPSFSGRTHSEYMPAYDGLPKPESSYKSKSEFVNDVFKYVNHMVEVSKALGTDEDLSHVDELKKMNDILKDIFSEIEAGLDDPRIDDKSKAKLAQLGTDLSSNWGRILSNMVPNGDERFDAVYHKAHTINATSKDTTGGQINRDVSESAQQTLAEQEENRRKAEEEEQARLEEAKNRNYKTYEDYATNVEFLKGWIDSAKDPSELETISKEIQDTIEEATRNNTLEHTSQGAVITMLNNLLSNDLGQKKHAMEISQPFLNFSDDRTKWAQFIMDEKDEAKHDQLYDAYMELLETDPVMSQDPEKYQDILDAAADADTESEMAESVPIEQSTPESPEPETRNDETERVLSDQLKATVGYMWSNFDSDYDEDKFEKMLTLIKNNSALQFKEKDDLLQRADIFRKMADMAQDAPHGAVNQADYTHVKEKLMNLGDGEDVLKMLQTLENIKLKSDKHNPAADRDQRSQDSILREEYDTEDSENPSKDVSEGWTLDSMDYERAKQIYNNTFGEDEPDNGEEPEWDHLVDLIYDSADSFSTEFSIGEMINDLTELMELYDLDQREQDRLLRRVDSIPTMGENLRLYDARRSENGGPGKDVEPKSFREIMRERNPDWE